MVSEEANRILIKHCDKLTRLVDILDGISPANRTVLAVELVAKNADGTSQEVTLDTDELDTYLLLTGLSELAKTRVEQLRSKIKENEDARTSISIW